MTSTFKVRFFLPSFLRLPPTHPFLRTHAQTALPLPVTPAWYAFNRKTRTSLNSTLLELKSSLALLLGKLYYRPEGKQNGYSGFYSQSDVAQPPPLMDRRYRGVFPFPVPSHVVVSPLRRRYHPSFLASLGVSPPPPPPAVPPLCDTSKLLRGHIHRPQASCAWVH